MNQRKAYPKEFKEEAVKLIIEQGYSVSEASESLGVARNVLYNWKNDYERRQNGLSLVEDERAELMRLRKENKQ